MADVARADRAGRVVVLLTDSPHARRAMWDAAELATLERVALHGVFVEESDLLRSADFPFAQEMGTATATLRPMSPGVLRDQLRRNAVRLRMHLEELARERDLPCSFDTARGRVPEEAARIAAPEDWLVLGRAGRFYAAGGRLGHSAASLAVRSPCRTFFSAIMETPRHLCGVAVLAAEAVDVERVVGTAVALRRGKNEPVVVILPAQPEHRRRELQDALDVAVARYRIQPIYHPLSSDSTAAVAGAASLRGPRLLIAALAREGGTGPALLEAIPVPLVFVP